jgi:hypothetical protein
MDDHQIDEEFHRGRFHYIFTDPETSGRYKVVSATALTPEQIEEIVASVIADEGRVKAGTARTIWV